MRRALFSLLALIATAVACSEPLELADWRIDVPPGTRVIELPAVPLEERNAASVQLVDDLVLGGDSNDQEALFFRPLAIVATENGRMFVADRGDSRVVMFAPDGTYSGSFGREGQGPGEFGRMAGIAAVGEHIVIEDAGNQRVSLWTMNGVHVADHALESRWALLAMEGMGEDAFVSSYIESAGDDRRLTVARKALDGSELTRLFDEPQPPPMVIRDGQSATEELVRRSIEVLDYPEVLTAAGGADIAYLSPAHEYQVLAISADGSRRWALRVAWPRPPLAEGTKAALVERRSRSGTGTAAVDDFEWPPASALEFLRSDGAGNLYVFPTTPREEDEPAGPRMVDVYSPEGELLAAGWVDHVWSHARGDYVYGLRTNERDEQVAVRYRLTVTGR
jgi:hypothetical protein